MFITTVDDAQKAGRSFRTVFYVIGILIFLGGVFLGIVSSGGFILGRFMFKYMDPLVFAIYVVGSLLSALVVISIGRVVYHAMNCLSMIAHNSGKK